MQRVGRLLRFASLSVFTLLFSSALLAQQADRTVVQRGDVKEDVYLVGGSVYALGRVDGDVVAAGGQIDIENDIRGDVLSAGGTVTIRANVQDDLRAAGGRVTVSGNIGDDALASGGTVVLAPTSTVNGRAWLAGGNIEVLGKVGKSLRAAGGRVVIDGEVAGDVELFADTIEIGSGAVIGGDLRYRSRNEAKIDSRAKISGVVMREQLPGRRDRAGAVGSLARIGFYLSLMLTAVVMFLLFPMATLGGARTVSDSPWKSLGLGLGLLAATPLAIVLLAVTLVGLWLALALLALYLVLLLAGFLTGILFLGDLGLGWIGQKKKPNKSWRALSIVGALVALWIISLIPVLGGLVMFILLLFGLGGLALHLARRYATAR